MTKAEIIQVTLSALCEGDVLWPGTSDVEPSDAIPDYVTSVAIPTLMMRLPECDIKTCGDLSTGVKCCQICHFLYPHYDMYLEDLPDGSKAWICCQVRSTLRNPGGSEQVSEEEWVDLEEALGGGLRKRDLNGGEEEGAENADS